MPSFSISDENFVCPPLEIDCEIPNAAGVRVSQTITLDVPQTRLILEDFSLQTGSDHAKVTELFLDWLCETHGNWKRGDKKERPFSFAAAWSIAVKVNTIFDDFKKKFDELLPGNDSTEETQEPSTQTP